MIDRQIYQHRQIFYFQQKIYFDRQTIQRRTNFHNVKFVMKSFDDDNKQMHLIEIEFHDFENFYEYHLNEIEKYDQKEEYSLN